MIKKFGSLYAGHVDLDNLGLDGTPVNDRWLPDEQLLTAFEKETGAKLDIQYQTWSNYTTKLDTALLSGNAPDALELGNTQTAKYINAGSFVDLTSVKSQFDNSAQWTGERNCFSGGAFGS